jgi:replicative DNA helicase
MAKQPSANNSPSGASSVERIPPHSEEAEMSLLGAMLLDRHAAGDALLIAHTDDFYLPAHRQIAEVLTRLYDDNIAIDIITMEEALKQKGWLEESGGTDYLVRLAESVPSAANAEHYATIVRNKAVLRNFVNAAGDLIRDAYAENRSVDEFLDEAEQTIFDVTERRSSGQPDAIRDVVKVTFDEIEAAAKGGPTGLATGFIELDDILNGMRNGEMIVLAARPSVGKTTLAMNIAMHVAVNEKAPVAFFSLEMRKTEVAKRMLAARAAIDMHEMGKGVLEEGDRGRLVKAAGELAEAVFFIDDTPGQTVFDIRAKSRRLKAQHDISLVVIDYMQLMQQPRRAENRQVEVAEISRAIKALARELEVPVMALSQLNREVEHTDRLPRLSDIRESGAIEQDADVVLLLHRAVIEESEHGDSTSEATIVVAKHRNGRTGKLSLQFQGPYVRFVTPSHRKEYADA